MKQLKKCITCEHYHERQTGIATCHINPAVTDGSYNFPKVLADQFCSKWKPKWTENETITKAWKEFQMIVKLAEVRKEDD